MSPTKTATNGNVWTDEERAAMQSSARERKTSSRRDPAEERAEGLRDLQAAIAKMPEADRPVAERFHGLVMAVDPDLAPKTYYGMPAYAKDGTTIFWFKNAGKFKQRYGTIEFSDKAKLDDGEVWPVSFALKELTASAEAQITALVKKAVG